MTSICVVQAESPLRLHSCAACGWHSWRSRNRDVDRSTVLQALRVARRPARPASAGPPSREEGASRSELRRLLSGFSVHGSSS